MFSSAQTKGDFQCVGIDPQNWTHSAVFSPGDFDICCFFFFFPRSLPINTYHWFPCTMKLTGKNIIGNLGGVGAKQESHKKKKTQEWSSSCFYLASAKVSLKRNWTVKYWGEKNKKIIMAKQWKIFAFYLCILLRLTGVFWQHCMQY